MDLKEDFINSTGLKELFANMPDDWHVLQLGDTERYCAYKGVRLSRLEVSNKVYTYKRIYNDVQRHAWCCQEQFFVGSYSELAKIMQKVPVEVEDRSSIIICKISKEHVERIIQERPSCIMSEGKYVAYRAEELMDSDDFYEHLLYYTFSYQKVPANHNKTFVITCSYDTITQMINF